MAMSAHFRDSSDTPKTSFPNTKANLSSVLGLKSFKLILLFVCSIKAIFQPFSLSFFSIFEIHLTYSHSIDSVDPRAVLSISLFGGYPVIPTK